jgi:hypothetical protein
MAISQTGPLTKNAKTLALGLAQIRVSASVTATGAGGPSGTEGYVGYSGSNLRTSGSHIGAIATTRLTLEREYYTHEAGFPLLEDAQLPIRERAQLECAFEEITAYNMMLAAGKTPVTSTSGELLLGDMALPAFIRMEAHYQFPDSSKMVIIFPRSQVMSNTELEFQKEEASNAPMTFKAQRADAGMTDGAACWDSAPLGRIVFVPSGSALP